MRLIIRAVCLRDSTASEIMFRRIPRLSNQVRYHSMKVVPVPVRDDNYAYLLIDESTNKAAAIDPYDVNKVSAAADAHGVEIIAGITTHHHFDHSGGNQVCNP
jgi:glyoxylase-like metal-dependent hydrolase (beta-lactamase superfamily II)